MPLPAETNAAIGKVSARPNRQIISALEKIGMFAPNRAISSTTGKKFGRNLFFDDVSRIFATKSRIAPSQSSFGRIQLVFSFASFNAFAIGLNARDIFRAGSLLSLTVHVHRPGS